MDNKELRTPLPAGTVLRCGGARYILGDTVSFGGSSVFYSAKKEDSALPFGVKECCPAELAERLCRKNGVLTGADEAVDDALSQARARLLKEAEISQKVAAVSSRSIPVWEASQRMEVETAEGAAPAPEGSFLLLRRVSAVGMFLPKLLEECALPKEEGYPLRTGGRPHIRTIARVLEQTLRAVELVHQAGYLYGDVQPNNLFFADARPEKGNAGFGCLLDFGCARPFVDGEKTAPITDRMVFSTPGYTAPEIIWDNDGTLQLTPAADIYSAGRLLLYLLKGRSYYENGRDRVLEEGAVLTQLLPAEGERLGCTGEILRQTQRILEWSLCVDPKDRYQTAGEMLEDVEKLVLMTQPPANRLALSFSALAEGEFLGREEKFSEIDRALRQHRKPVALWGFAGMGKTELAIEFGRRYERDNRGQVYFVRFQDSVRQTVTGPIADAFSGYDRKDAAGQEKPEEQIYREVMKLLGERDENDLLILDNMDGDAGGFDALCGEPAFQDLCALPMRLLVTTRSEVPGGVEADELPLPLLRKLMRRFVPTLSDEMADKLIAAVEGHTLTVELMGRTLKVSIPRISPEALLEKMEKGDFDSHVFASVSSSKDRAGKMARIQGHLIQLFRLSALPIEEKQLMAYALPISEVGLAAEDFARTPVFDQDALLRLIDRGWVRRSEDDILTLHLLVRETGWRELEPNVDVLLNFAWGMCHIAIFNLRCSNTVLEQRLGYTLGIYRHTEAIPQKTGAGLCASEFLQLQGRLLSAFDLARELLGWIEKAPERNVYPDCVREALRICSNCSDELGLTGYAAAYQERADALGVPLPEDKRAKTPEDFLFDGMTGVEAESVARVTALHELMDQERHEDALRKYEGDRQWFLENGLDTTHLDIYSYAIWYKLGDAKRAYLALRKTCGEMDEGKRITGVYITMLLQLVDWDLDLERYKEAQALLAYAAKQLQKLFPDERRRVLTKHGDASVKLAWKHGWVDEAVAWLNAIHEFKTWDE